MQNYLLIGAECPLNAYEDIQALRNASIAYIEFYNNVRFHQSLNYKTPVQLYRGEH
ncbi:MAG: transposase [Gammaproteobacteria bacterium]|nr:transposase [Gammaproteobacteria bacterium]